MCHKAPSALSDTFAWLSEELVTQREKTNKYIIYCRSIMACASLFKYFGDELGDKAYFGDPSYRSRLYAMFHHSTSKRIKQYIINTFHKTDSAIRVVIATVAFGMGIDVPDIFMVIHWGASRSFHGFYQESGRAGRNASMQAYSLVYYHPMDISAIATDADMRGFCLNETDICRRERITKFFTPQASLTTEVELCCDACSEKSPIPIALPWKCLEHIPDTALAELHLSDNATKAVTEEQREQVQIALKEYVQNLIDKHSIVNPSISIGMDSSTIKEIVNNIHVIHQTEDLLTGYLYDKEVAEAVFGIIQTILG